MVKRSIEQDVRNKRRGQESGDTTACTKNSWRLLQWEFNRGSLLEETIAVSATILISVEK